MKPAILVSEVKVLPITEMSSRKFHGQVNDDYVVNLIALFENETVRSGLETFGCACV